MHVNMQPVRWDRTVRFGTVLLLIPYYTVKATIRRTPYRIYGVILEIRRSATALIVMLKLARIDAICCWLLHPNCRCLRLKMTCIAIAFCRFGSSNRSCHHFCFYVPFAHRGGRKKRRNNVRLCQKCQSVHRNNPNPMPEPAHLRPAAACRCQRSAAAADGASPGRGEQQWGRFS